VLCRPAEGGIRLLPLSNYSCSRDLAVAFGLFGVPLFPRPVDRQEKGKTFWKVAGDGFATRNTVVVTCELIRIAKASHWPGKCHPRRQNRQRTPRHMVITGSLNWLQPEAMGYGWWRANTGCLVR